MTDVATTLHRLFENAWEFTMREHPTFATHCGDHRFDHRLPAVSPEDASRRAGQARIFLDQLEAIDRAALSPGDQLNYDMFARELRDDLDDFRFKGYLMPLSRLGGFHSHFADMPQHLVLTTLDDYRNFLERIRAFGAFCRGHIALMHEGIDAGCVQSKPALDGVTDTIEPLIVDDPEASSLFAPFKRLPDSMSSSDRAALAASARAAIADVVMPALRELLAFVRTEYLPAARKDIAARSLPDGPAFYEHCVRKFTTLDVTPEQVHHTGCVEVERIMKDMHAVIRSTGFSGSFKEFLAQLRTATRFYADSAEALLKEAAYASKRIDGELPRLFTTLPRMPYGLRPIPAHAAPRTTSAYYMLPSGDGKRAGFYYLNTHDVKSRPLYELMALTLHEAVPGHHLQFALQMELTNLPKFRLNGSVTAYAEGWALYAERLGLDVGLYDNPYSDFGRLTFEMWRACRLVVDTGIHYLGWSRQQAIDYMADRTALSLLNIQNEIDRYIAVPGQALAYMTGAIAIRDLRKEAEAAHGSAFDLRAFHDLILRNGPVPLAVLETTVRDWIRTTTPVL